MYIGHTIYKIHVEAGIEKYYYSLFSISFFKFVIPQLEFTVVV